MLKGTRNFLLSLLAIYSAYGVYADDKGYKAVGTSYYLPNYNLLGDDMTGGYPVFKTLPKECITETQYPKSQQKKHYFKTTEKVYSHLSTENSIAGELATDFTMGATLDVTTNSISGTSRSVSGLTFKAFQSTLEDALSHRCMTTALNEQLVKEFERLPNIDDPALPQSWTAYKNFLKVYGSHVVTDVIYGCSFYQHVFSESNKHYTKRDFQVKACAALGGPTGRLDVSVCSGVTKEDIKAVSSLVISSHRIARGGKDETRAEMQGGVVTDELVTKFLSEAKETHQPIQYKFMPIWTILQAHYLHTDLLAKALNLEAFYKGYMSYGCHYSVDKTVTLQKFRFSQLSTPEHPMYECIIASAGCQDDDDCHYHFGPRCSCYGESCVIHKDKKLDTGTKKTIAEINTQADLDWLECSLNPWTIWTSCYCTEPGFSWDVVWKGNADKNALTSILRSKAAR